MNKTNDNICFFLEEKADDNKELNDSEIQKMLNEFMMNEVPEDDLLLNDRVDEDNKIDNLRYFFKKDLYNNNELYYDQEYTVKELLKICKYYGIDKELKASKCKKQDILDTIIFFEVLPENSEIVERRHRMWAYITELINDPKMKQFILWN
jgi:hypothetical protein